MIYIHMIALYCDLSPGRGVRIEIEGYNSHNIPHYIYITSVIIGGMGFNEVIHAGQKQLIILIYERHILTISSAQELSS